MPHQFEASKVLQYGYSAPAEDFHSLLGIGPIAVRQVADRALRSVRKSERDYDIVVGVQIGAGHAARSHFDRQRSGHECEEIYEMANLSKNSSAALLGIIDPVIARDETSVDAIMQRQWLIDPFEKRSHPRRHRSEPTVEINHQYGIAARDATGVSANNFG